MSHPATQPRYSTGDEKRAYVKQMFADISPTYDFVNSAMSFRFHHRWRVFAVGLLGLKEGDTVLDVCSGTGDFLRPLRRKVGSSGRVFGADFCRPMLERAARKTISACLLAGDATSLPIRSNSVDAITVGWGLRNVPDLKAALREIHRVLKPGGRFVSLEMAVPRSRVTRAVSGVFTRRALPLFGSAITKSDAYRYLPESTEKFASRDEQVMTMRSVGFHGVRYHDLCLGNICTHLGEK